ncbi:hypothetical protein [Vibrio anguillarum]|nr:hypothetical protein [Vibrio anguillarum]ATC59492.1 hypothetical protein CMV05_18615 [Vibrio anguillarum]ATC59494.1 hypothetical protein CMV05_18630 [Vibrio anguillarum]ATC59515.1 hypothetical protein CMV05_18850 [Vibrio anguillarum]MBF4217558.1 hypothetical protein [Vibrio anguillarum]MBF4252793.1 hypothetical protein [Vibrio anguillarum]
MDTIIQNNESLNNPAQGSVSFSHKKKSCENYTLPGARALASDLNSLSLFLMSDAWQSTSDDDVDILQPLLSKLQLKIDELESCLAYLDIHPQLDSNH